MQKWISVRSLLETSLVVQWLRLCTPNAGGPGLIPGQGTRFNMPQLRPREAKEINTYSKENVRSSLSFLQFL